MMKLNLIYNKKNLALNYYRASSTCYKDLFNLKFKIKFFNEILFHLRSSLNSLNNKPHGYTSAYFQRK